MERLWLQSMTKKSILRRFQAASPRSQDYDGLSDAAHCRNYSDWLIGMNATRALTRRLKTRSENQAWSAGRVQTPTLGMLVDREVEILNHVPVGLLAYSGRIRPPGRRLYGQLVRPGVQERARKTKPPKTTGSSMKRSANADHGDGRGAAGGGL